MEMYDLAREYVIGGISPKKTARGHLIRPREADFHSEAYWLSPIQGFDPAPGGSLSWRPAPFVIESNRPISGETAQTMDAAGKHGLTLAPNIAIGPLA
jgi:hypothetical protein